MDAIQTASIPTPVRPAKWSGFLLYFFGGFGVFCLSTIALAFIFRGLSIWLPLALAVCNALFLGGSFYTLGVRRGETSFAGIGFIPSAWRWRYLWIALGISIIFIPLRSGLGLLVQMLISGNLNSVNARMDIFTGGAGFSWLNFAISFLSIAVIPPISEELYFRGLLHTWMQGKLGYWPRVLLSSALFSLAHIDSIGVMVSTLFLGMINAISYEKSKSLWLPILIHFITNAVAIVLLYGMMAAGQTLK